MPRPRQPICTPARLPEDLVEPAAANAIAIHPANAPVLDSRDHSELARLGVTLTPAFLAVITSKRWAPKPRTLSVQFLDGGTKALRAKILSHMNAWAEVCCIDFAETAGAGEVRITRGEAGYWSFLGTDILMIQGGRPTMCLQGFTEKTSDAEYRRVVRHEVGHTLGCPHEHATAEIVALISPAKAYAYFQATQGWDRATVDSQVLTPLDERSVMRTPSDQTSIMCYQFPSSITRNGKPILGGADLNASDRAFIAEILPKTVVMPPPSTDVLTSQGSAVTIGGKSYRLTTTLVPA